MRLLSFYFFLFVLKLNQADREKTMTNRKQHTDKPLTDFEAYARIANAFLSG
jgi:hypothetical protein